MDDNNNFLNSLTNLGLGAITICAADKCEISIIDFIKKLTTKNLKIIVNISLKYTSKDKRLDFKGLKLIQQLGFIFTDVRFIAFSFLDYNYVLNSSSFAKTILECEEVTFKNYIEFIKEYFVNDAGEINGKNN